MTRLSAFFRMSPYGVMTVVLVMYILKVVFKLTVGYATGSQMLVGDGWHNGADIFEAMMVVGTIALARLPQNETYPFGRKNLESLFAVLVALFLFGMAVKILLVSLWSGAGVIVSLLNWQVPLLPTDPASHAASYTWLALLVVGLSAGASVLVSRYQIAVGKRTGHESLVADGKETMSDGFIELVVLIGVLLQIIGAWIAITWNAPWAQHLYALEYVFAILVAVKMIQTAWEIFWEGLDALLQKTIGVLHESKIRDIIKMMHGAEEVESLKTFRVGNKPILIMKLTTSCSPQTTAIIKRALMSRFDDYLLSEDFEQPEYYIRFGPLQDQPCRVGYFVISDADTVILAPSARLATHLRVCDVVRGEVVRSRDELVWKKSFDEIVALIRLKRLVSVWVFAPRGRDPEERGYFEAEEILYHQASSYNPRVLGIDSR